MGTVLSCSKKKCDVFEDTSPMQMDDQEFDEIICNVADLPKDGMKSFPLGEGEVLLVHHKGRLSAVGSKCTHYGAPLVKGVLGEDGTIRCPWHGACFNSSNGDIEDYPGSDSLPCYSISLDEGCDPDAVNDDGVKIGRAVRLRGRRSQLIGNKRTKQLARRDPNNNKIIVVVGGGGAGSACVEGLREGGYTGRVVLVCGEQHIPYDRPKLSKNLAATPDNIALRSLQYYESGDIELVMGNPALSLNSSGRQLLLTDGTTLSYNQLFLATGGSPRSLQCPGSSLAGVVTLRSPEDAAEILRLAHDKHVVIVGASFIGLELASHLSLLGASQSVSVVGGANSTVAYERALGPLVGGRLQQLVQEQGVAFYMKDTVQEIKGDGGDRVEEVLLRSGTALAAGVVVCGVGVTPATGYLEGSGVQLDDTGHVLVDQYLESSVAGVYAGGDIAAFPLQYGGQRRDEGVHIGHWQVALQHGHTAAANMISVEAGGRRGLDSVPMFWTVLQGKSLRYAGYGGGYDDVLVGGDLPGLSFIAYYLREDKVVAVASLGMDPAVAKFAELLKKGGVITRGQVDEDDMCVMKC